MNICIYVSFKQLEIFHSKPNQNVNVMLTEEEKSEDHRYFSLDHILTLQFQNNQNKYYEGEYYLDMI